jgi:hypothetical protein
LILLPSLCHGGTIGWLFNFPSLSLAGNENNVIT